MVHRSVCSFSGAPNLERVGMKDTVVSEARFSSKVVKAFAPWAITGFILGTLGGLLSGFGFVQTMKVGSTLALGGYFVWLSVKGIKMIFFEDNDQPGG